MSHVSPEALDQIVHLRISTTEKQMLTELADQSGLKLSQVVRQLIRKAYDAELGAQSAKRKRK